MKTIYFYGLTELGFFASLLLVDPIAITSTKYHFGALEITFHNQYKKSVGKAISKMHKNKNFRQVQKSEI